MFSSIFNRIRFGNQGVWIGLSALALLVALSLSLHRPAVCGVGEDGLKRLLQIAPKQSMSFSSDKRVVESMLETLRIREEELARREQELEASRLSLHELEQRLKEQMATIKKIKEETESLLKQAEAEKQTKIDSLVALYGTMNSQNSAAALLELFKEDKALVAAVFEALNKRRAASILDAITVASPKVAAEITMLIGRHR